MALALIDCVSVKSRAQEPISVHTRRELFVDKYLIDKLDKVWLQLQHPQSAGIALFASASGGI